ncbi:MAG TPA: lycopene cyclase family protein [Aldersonia sp.]
MGAVDADVVVVGLGPAGRALAHRCLARGLRVIAVDPHPERAWRATYAAWADELPAWLPGAAVAAHVDHPQAWTTVRQPIARGYRILDSIALHAALDLGHAEVIAARAIDLVAGRVYLDDGTTLSARVVVDARGVGAPAGLPQQTAYGLMIDSADAVPVLDGADAWFMDWRADHGADPGDPPSFLYAVPLGSGVTLVEETCLVGRPPLDLGVLRDRLVARLAARGMHATGAEPVERVRFAVEPPTLPPATVSFGSRAGLGHPCTGYSVAASLAAADLVAAGIAAGEDPRRVLHPPRSRLVGRLRRMGLRALLGMPADQTAAFFAAFFTLPVGCQRAYLSGRADPVGTAAAMARTAAAAPAPVRARLFASAVDPRLARHIPGLRS